MSYNHTIIQGVLANSRIDADYIDVEYTYGQENLQVVLERMIAENMVLMAVIADLQQKNKELADKIEICWHTGKYGYK
jgi:hypothetical protein